MENQQFIEIKRVLSNEEKINVSIQPESIDIALIESFRGWHKGRNDQNINGDMTLLVLKNRESAKPESDDSNKPESDDSNKPESDDSNKPESEEVRPKSKVRTMLIQESYSQFLNRMSASVVVRRLE